MRIIKRLLAPIDRWAELRGMDPFWFYVVLFFFVLGLLWTGQGIWEIRMGLQSHAWPAVEGRVTSSRVETHSSQGTGMAGGGGGARGGTSHHPRICYTYAVSGTAYESCRYRFGDPGGQRRSEELVAAHPVGTRVAVHYRPDEPGTAVLRPGAVGWGYYSAPVLGLLAVGITGSLLVWLLRRRPRDANDD